MVYNFLPYKVEYQFKYKGYYCCIIVHDMGHRTAYVGLTPNDKYYGTICHDDVKIACHGGVTFSDAHTFYCRWSKKKRLHKKLMKKHKLPRVLNEKRNHYWYIGFDTGHYNDRLDVSIMSETFKKLDMYMSKVGHLRTKEFCINECKSMVDQLIREG